MFEDVVLGERDVSPSWTISEEEIIAFARQYDPLGFHIDPDVAARSSFGGIIASGLHTLALFRRLDHEMSGDLAIVAGIGFDNVRFQTPLRPGDMFRLETTVTATIPSKSGQPRGTVRKHCRMFNQDDMVVLSLEAIGLVRSRTLEGRGADA